MKPQDLDDLARKVAAGNAAAYTPLLRDAARVVRAYVSARVTGNDRAVIEDIVQDTLLAVHTKFQTYDPAMPFMPWLRTIAHHKLIDHWRRQKIAFLVTIEDSDAELVAADTPQTEAAITLEKLFEKLSDKQRRVVQMARLDGKSMAEIAAELGVSVSDAKVTLHRAIMKLSDYVQREHDKGASHANG